MSKKMTQEKLNREFTVLRTGLAIGIGVLLSVIIILLVSDEPLLSIKDPCSRGKSGRGKIRWNQCL